MWGPESFHHIGSQGHLFTSYETHPSCDGAYLDGLGISIKAERHRHNYATARMQGVPMMCKQLGVLWPGHSPKAATSDSGNLWDHIKVFESTQRH